MSHHILHLLSHDLKVRCELDRLVIQNRVSEDKHVVPLQDVSIVIAATPDFTITGGSLKRMAELGVLLLVCNDKFEPACLTLPYYRATSTHVLRAQMECPTEWKRAMWRQIITCKIRHQAKASALADERLSGALEEISKRCAEGTDDAAPVNLSHLTVGRREGFHASSPEACESRAARLYWRKMLPKLSAPLETSETRREPGTREGANGMLDYGYAIMRTAVLRSLAAHGYIAALGIAHAPKAGSFALADDLMEPLRPFIDQALLGFLSDGPQPFVAWVKCAANLLIAEVPMPGGQIRLINAIDAYVQSFSNALLARQNLPLVVPPLSSVTSSA